MKTSELKSLIKEEHRLSVKLAKVRSRLKDINNQKCDACNVGTCREHNQVM